MTPLLIILIWLTTIAAKVVWNWYRIEKEQKDIAHGPELLIMCLLGFVQMWFVCDIHNYSQRFEFQDVLIFQASTYYFFFDTSLNLMRGKSWFYLGYGANSDRFWKKMGKPMYIMSKICMIPFIVYGTIWIYRYY